MRKIILPLLLLISQVSFSQSQPRNNGDSTKITWAFPVTGYMVDLNDSVKVVQVQLPDAFPVKEKQLGVLRGVYNTSHADTAQKGYGRCHLIKGDFYYFSIGNNKSGMWPKQGDLLYTLIDKPAIFTGQVVKLAAHYIELDNVYDQPLYDRVGVYYQWAESDEKRMIDSAVNDIKFTGNYFLANNPSMNQLIDKGLYKGQKVLNLMMQCKASQVNDFMSYIIARPRLYAGKKWKISEIFATWLVEGAPAVIK
ncbi:MAG: hypothetical protein HOP10_15535 [Chitinophagaceae bacterium]|nr:hypothetical protein [Chitinophagaceae bacterium]